MSSIRRLRRGLVALALVFACVVTFAARAEETITMGLVGFAPALQWPIYIGISQGIFAADGIKIDGVSIQSSAGVQQQVAAGSVAIGVGGLVDPLRAIEKGAPMAMLRFEGGIPPYTLLGKPTIKKIEDLKGKTIMLGGVADITRIYVERMLAPHGIKPGEFDMVYAGATSDRFNALQAGAVDATILGPPFDYRAEGLGFTNLGLTMDYVKDMPFTAYSIYRPWAEKNRPLVAKFLASYQKCVDWFYDTANREKAIDIVFGMAKGERSDAVKSYDFFQKIQFFDKRGKIVTADLEKDVDVLVKLGALEKPIPLDQLVMKGVTPVE